MVGLLVVLAFVGGAGFALVTLAVTVAPNFGKIVDALFGRQVGAFEPLTQLAQAERRIAVRRWSAESPVPAYRTRAAA